MLEANELMPILERGAILADARPFDPLTRLAGFETRYPNSFKILLVGGVHPTNNVTVMENPYTHRLHDESFANVGEHCLAVASLAQTLSLKLLESGALSPEEADSATSRALVHDANKRLEVMRRNAVKEGVENEAYTPRAYETIRPILISQGVDPELVEYMVKAGEETGHLSIGGFLRLEDGIPSLKPGRLVDKIVHLADDMTSTSIPEKGERPLTVYLTPWERMVASEFPRRYPMLWEEGLAFGSQDEIVTLEDVSKASRNLRWIRNFAFWQPFTSNAICREILAIVDPESKQRPEYFVKDLVNKALIPAA